MGDKGGDDKYGKEAGRIARKRYQKVEPLEDMLIERFRTGMEGGFDPTQTPFYQPARQTLEDQYKRAQESIIGNMPRGGQMLDALANADFERAKSLGGLEAQIAADEYNKLYGVATGTPQQSLGVLGSLAGQQAQANAQAQGAKMGFMGDIGQAVGYWLAS